MPLPALDRVLAAGRARYTGPEAAARAGADPAWAAAVWRAAGFDGDFTAPELSDDDARILAAVAELARSGRIEETELLRLARLFNLAAAPLAEGAAASILAQRAEGDVELDDLEEALAMFEDVVLHAWRRRLLRVLARGGLTERVAEGVGFADLSGFTALVQRGDDDRWLDVLDRLEAVAFDVVAGHGGRVVKTIGDEVMFVNPDPSATVATCVDLARASGAGTLPPLRVAASWGEVVATRGDRFGAPVNLASRLVRRSRPGEVLLCPSLGPLAAGGRRARPYVLKGMGVVRPFRVRPGLHG